MRRPIIRVYNLNRDNKKCNVSLFSSTFLGLKKVVKLDSAICKEVRQNVYGNYFEIPKVFIPKQLTFLKQCNFCNGP